MTEPCHLSAVEARRLIGIRKLSPVELLDSCLKRIAATNPAVNAIVALDEKRARGVAKRQEADVMRGSDLGLLHGLPIGIKDLDATEGLRTTWGSLLFKDHVPEADNLMVSNVRAAGANIIGKTNTPEFGAGGNTTNAVYGPTANPFDSTLTSGGSSGGSAAALALDMVPLATGSDYAGSLRTPASFCGVVGFRPSPGVVPSAEKVAGLLPWGVLGPMGRTVADAHLLLKAQMDRAAADPFSSADNLEIPETLLGADLSALRVAYSPDFGVCPVEQPVRDLFLKRVARFKSSFACADAATPDFTGLHHVFNVHRGLTYLAMHQEKLERSRDLLGPNVIDNTERGLKLSASEIACAFVDQQSLYKRVLSFFDDYDVLIAPAAGVAPFAHDQWYPKSVGGADMEFYTTWLSIAYAPTMALCTALALPCGVDAAGLPFGIQIIGPKGGDALVLEVGHALEKVLADDRKLTRARPRI